MFCKYSEIFGKPKEGLHSYRLFNIAIIDVLLTILFGILIHKFIIIKYFKNIHILITIITLFIIGIIMHRLFCVRTTIDKLLFLNYT